MRRRIFGCFVLLLFLLTALLTGQNHLTVSTYDCAVTGLPDAFDGFRILQLSDLHGAEFGKSNTRLIKKVRELRPDIVVLTGDFIENKDDLAATGRLFPALAEIAPCYFVSGNHEWASGGMDVLEAQLKSAGIVYLANEYVPLGGNGNELLFCGVEDPNSWADLSSPETLVELARSEYPGVPIILLGHRNYWVEKYPDLPVELILCGHGHGGIVRIPGIGGLVGTDRLLFPEYTEGMHRSGSYNMIISRGLGRIYGLPRIFNSPEIVVATLKKAA